MSTCQHTLELLAQFNRYPPSPPPNTALLSDCEAGDARLFLGIYYIDTLLFVGDDTIYILFKYTIPNTVLLFIFLSHGKPVKKF